MAFPRKIATIPPRMNPCDPSPCGPYSQCHEVNQHAVCSCQTDFIGMPPNCRPECVVSSECAQDKACLNQQCKTPCVADVCAPNAICRVVNHNAICSCSSGFTGDPFIECSRVESKIFSLTLLFFYCERKRCSHRLDIMPMLNSLSFLLFFCCPFTIRALCSHKTPK